MRSKLSTTSADPDLRLLTDRQVAALLVANQAELGLDSELCVEDVSSFGFVLEREHAGRAVAVVDPKDVCTGAHLWILYVLPSHRGKGVGKEFLKRILERHAGPHPFSLCCVGPERAAFFQKCGFEIVSTDAQTGVRQMER
jgi:GNAT superfamily N-acetyltransferase